MVAAGAAIVFRNDPDQTPHGVAWIRRVNANRHFYFTPGFSDFDAHRIDFAQERVLYDGLGVEFLDKDGRLQAYLTTVEEQQTDPVAAESIRQAIAEWKRVFDAEDYFRGNVLKIYQDRGNSSDH